VAVKGLRRRLWIFRSAQLLLSKNNIGDEGAVALAKALAANRTLAKVCCTARRHKDGHVCAIAARGCCTGHWRNRAIPSEYGESN